MFNSDDEEEKKKRALGGAPVETITPTIMMPERVGGPAPVETITPTIMAPEKAVPAPVGTVTPSLAQLKGVPKEEEKSVWDTIVDTGSEFADKVGEVGRGAMSYMMDDEAEFKKKWLDENLGSDIMADRDPVKLAEHQKKMEAQAGEAWKQRQFNRKLIGGALGGIGGALKGYGERKAAKKSGPSVNKATYGGQLGTGYRRGGK